MSMVSASNKSVVSQMCTDHGKHKVQRFAKQSLLSELKFLKNLYKSCPPSPDRTVNSIQPFDSLIQEPGHSPRYLQSIVWSVHEASIKHGMNKLLNKQVGAPNTTNMISLPREFCRARPGLIMKYRNFAPCLLNSMPRILPQMNSFFLCFASNIYSYI